MARKARKYCLDVIEAQACGLGSYGNIVTVSLLNGFTVDGCTYPTLTTEQLQSLSTLDYDERVLAFLDYAEVGDTTCKEELFDEASFDSDDCEDLFCLLNENFLVYRFLTGFRVVNVGSANGVIQYRAYPENANPDDYTWQSNGTFLNNIDLNLVYVIEVRDWYNNQEVCKVSQIQALSALVPSTTLTLPPKVVSLFQISCGSILDDRFRYKTGCFRINPTLSDGQCVSVNYTANASIVGASYTEGYSCVRIGCRPDGSTTFTTISCLTNSDISPETNNVIICDGDTICYNVTSNIGAGSYGGVSCANFCLTSVGGLSTTVPTIDTTNCTTSIQSSLAYLDLEGALTNNVCTQTSPTACQVSGKILFSPAIPDDYFVDVEFSSVTQTTGVNAVANTFFFTGTTESNYAAVCWVSQSCSQPQIPVIRVKGGTYACYRSVVQSTSAGESASSCLCINDVSGSFGLAPTVSGGSPTASISITNVATNVLVSMCNQYQDDEYSYGYINTDVPIPAGQCITPLFYYQWDYASDGYAYILILCQPQGGSMTPVCEITESDAAVGEFCITMRPNDTFQYQIAGYGTTYWAVGVEMGDIDSQTTGVNATINRTELSKYCAYIGNVLLP